MSKPSPRVRVSPPKVRAIIAEVAKAHDLQPRDLTGHDRFKHMIEARHEAIWRIRTETGISLAAIGNFFDGRDHTTARYAVLRHAERMAEAGL